MSDGMVAGLVAAGVATVVLIAALPLRRRFQRRLFARTGLEEWRVAAGGLSWRDRWKIGWANALGRRTEPRLARFAVQRGEAAIAVSERQWALGFRRWLRWLVAAVGVLAAADIVLNVLPDSQRVDWFGIGLSAVVCLMCGLLVLALGDRFKESDLRRLRRSVQRNRDLTDPPGRLSGRHIHDAV